MKFNQTFWILVAASLFCGCSLNDPPDLGERCGKEPFTELLGTVGNSLSELSRPDANLLNTHSKHGTCTVDYPYCIYPNDEVYAWDNGHGFACSICRVDELYCDVSTGGKKCIPVLNDAANCGACGNRCDSGICNHGKCVDSNSDENCGASMSNPDGTKCTGDLKCIDKTCKCPTGVYCDGHCIDLNTDERCGTTCENVTKCNTIENQTCLDGTCVCPNGYLLRDGHCIDPKRNNKYCGATDNSDGDTCDMKNRFICSDGKCICMDGYIKTDDNKCVDSLNDNDHCGIVEGKLVKCMKHSTCRKGVCACDVGYKKNNVNECIHEDRCGARGNAISNNPVDIHYAGYQCPDNSICMPASVPVLIGDSVQEQIIQMCVFSGSPSFTPPESMYNIYATDGSIGGYANPDRVEKCERLSKNGQYYTHCTCKSSDVGGELCQNDLTEVVSCGTSGAICTEELFCYDVSGIPRCLCPGGKMIYVNNGSASCIDSSIEHCGSASNQCGETQVCENGKCQDCGAYQTRCLGRCLENYDLDSATGNLSSFKDRHIQSCDLNSMVCEDGYGRCNDALFACDDSCCLKPNTNYKESYAGEYANAKCCHKAAPRKCHSAAIDANGMSDQYACRSQCTGYETDVTED